MKFSFFLYFAPKGRGQLTGSQRARRCNARRACSLSSYRKTWHPPYGPTHTLFTVHSHPHSCSRAPRPATLGDLHTSPRARLLSLACRQASLGNHPAVDNGAGAHCRRRCRGVRPTATRVGALLLPRLY